MIYKSHTNNCEVQGAVTKSILTFKEAVEYIGVSDSFLYKLTSSKRISFSKPTGKLIYFRKEDLDKWMLQNRYESLIELEDDLSSYLINSKR